MSTPDTTAAAAAGNSDAPTAVVKAIGPSEVTAILVVVAGLLDSYFGQDWGLGKNAQALGLLVAALAGVGMSIARAIKHHGAAHANAAVYVAQLNAAVQSASIGVKPAAITNAVTTINSAPVDDSIPDDLPADTQPPAA